MPSKKVDHGEQIRRFELTSAPRADQCVMLKVASGSDWAEMVGSGWPEYAVQKSRPCPPDQVLWDLLSPRETQNFFTKRTWGAGGD